MRSARRTVFENFPRLLDRDDAIRSLEEFLESVAPPRARQPSTLFDRLKGMLRG